MIDFNKKSYYDVAGIGSALLDFTVEADERDLERLGLRKGAMELIDGKRSDEIFSYLRSRDINVSPGGSSSNTLDGVSRMGGKSVFMGKVGSDAYGSLYIRETERAGVYSSISQGQAKTGHAITFITPDYERTFATHLGASLLLSSGDIDSGAIADSRLLHIEGYLFEPENLRAAVMEALKCALANRVPVSIDLSDPGLIGRIKPVFKELVENYAAIIFANEEEAEAYTGLKPEEAVKEIGRTCGFAAVKLGERGSIIFDGAGIIPIAPFKTTVINTNGAGDMYAAGLLYGLTAGLSHEQSGMLGSYTSSLIVARPGARLDSFIDCEKIVSAF